MSVFSSSFRAASDSSPQSGSSVDSASAITPQLERYLDQDPLDDANISARLPTADGELPAHDYVVRAESAIQQIDAALNVPEKS